MERRCEITPGGIHEESERGGRGQIFSYGTILNTTPHVDVTKHVAPPPWVVP
jgi:hypothetical protein